MKTKKIVVLSFYLMLAALAFGTIACAVNPVTKKRQFMLLSEAEEKALGKQTDQQILQTYGVYDNPALKAYLAGLGQRLAKLSHRPNLDYQFKLLDSPVVNAFAVPGGYIYMTRGILSYLNSEAELAGVMGHEIGHVAARHSAEQYSRAQVAMLGLGLGAQLSEDFRKVAGLAQVGTQLLFLKFGRDDERQSDRLGVEYATKAGYDAARMAAFFVQLDRMRAKSSQGVLPTWLSTHPNPANRVTSIGEMAQEWKKKVGGAQWVTEREAYLKKIDGIIYGDDPRQGYVEDGVFYHPQLTFQFPTPKQWELNNTPSQVQMVSPKEDAIVLLTLASESSPASVAKKFIDQTNANVSLSESVKVNGLDAHRMISEITVGQTQEQHLQVLSYFIKKAKHIYVFHGYTAPTQFDAYSTTFIETMEGFRPLTNASKINVEPTRLRIQKVKASGVLQSILRRFNVSEDRLDEVALLNGKQLDETISAGDLIKVLQER